VNYDPAWDMPLRNWQQQGSFTQPITPLEPNPGDGPLVCLPPVNQYWLPLILGCLDQLVNPSTWSTTTDDQLNAAIEQGEILKQMIGGRAVCPVAFELRVEGCDLQSSLDGGDTWTTVPGWPDFLANCIPPQTEIRFTEGCTLEQSLDSGVTWTAVLGWTDNFGNCIQDLAPIIGLPPNPGDESPEQLSCDIADYLATEIILSAMNAAVNAINDNLTLLSFGANVLSIIPEFILVRLGYDAISIIYADISEGMLSDYEDAIADPTLWVKVRCAIYDAIVTDGYVTPGNFSTILSRLSAITYTHPDVISAIVDYVTALGSTGLAQLSQGAGLNVGADCSSCAGSGWCYVWYFTVETDTWESYNPAVPAVWVLGTGWTGTYSPGASPPAVQTDIKIVGTFNGVESVEVFYTTNEVGGSAVREIYAVPVSGPEITGPLGSGIYTTPNATLLPIGADCTEIGIILRSAGSTDTPVITECVIRGTGTNPFGTSNCL